MEIIRSLTGLGVLVLFCYAISENRKKIAWKTICYGLILQISLALLLLKTPGSKEAFLLLNKSVFALEEATQAGTSFVFGFLGGGPLPFQITDPNAGTYIFAFRGLPLVLLASALSSLLFFWRILPLVVTGFAWVLKRTMNVGGAEGLSAAANIFLGMIEAPLFVKPYLSEMSRGELFSLMTTGMATIAGTVMVLYATFLKNVIPDAMGHLLIASIISAPAAITVSRLMVPLNDQAGVNENAVMSAPVTAKSSMEAITNGTMEGVKLLINIIAMLITLVAIIKLVNIFFGIFPDISGQPLTLERLFGWILAPVAWIIGVPWSECTIAGSLLGTKVVLNELIAFLNMSQLPENVLSPRSKIIVTYALCGFANFGSLGIMLGGLGGMAGDKRGEVVSLGLKSILSGLVATLMTGTVVGCFYF